MTLGINSYGQLNFIIGGACATSSLYLFAFNSIVLSILNFAIGMFNLHLGVAILKKGVAK